MGVEDFTFCQGLRDAITDNVASFAPRRAEGSHPRAAVAFAIVEIDGVAGFVLTQRALHLRHHPGQFALPGGRLDPDEGPVDAALRELHEEVGIAAQTADVVGRLDDFVTRSGFSITPVVVWAGSVSIQIDPDEVRRAYRVPVAELDRDDAPLLTPIDESDQPVLSMPLLGSQIYAPTAVFLYQFREVGLRGRSTRVDHFEQPLFAWR